MADYQYKEWLHHQYVELGNGTRKIAKPFGVSHAAIMYYVKKFKLPVHSRCVEPPNCKSFKYRDKEWLHEQYRVKKRSVQSIGEECGVNHRHILKWMKKFNIPSWEHQAQKRKLDLSTPLLEFVEGELLGDGCIVKSSPLSAHFSYGSKHKDYIAWLQSYMASYGVEFVSKSRIYEYQLIWENTGYFTQSAGYIEFMKLRQKWYPNGKKIVPPDLQLTPLMVRQWYIGDGSLAQWKGITLSTHGFQHGDVELLSSLLSELGINCNIRRDRKWYLIYVPKESARKLTEYIGPCPDEIQDIYGYKWPRYSK